MKSSWSAWLLLWILAGFAGLAAWRQAQEYMFQLPIFPAVLYAQPKDPPGVEETRILVIDQTKVFRMNGVGVKLPLRQSPKIPIQ